MSVVPYDGAENDNCSVSGFNGNIENNVEEIALLDRGGCACRRSKGWQRRPAKLVLVGGVDRRDLRWEEHGEALSDFHQEAEQQEIR